VKASLNVRQTSILVAVFCAIFVSAGLAGSPAFDFLSGLSLDALTAAVRLLSDQRRNSAISPTVIIALDEETVRSPPFKSSPTIVWTGEIGRVIAAVSEGGALAIGFDVIFPNSIEESAIDFEGETVGARLRGFDRDYLRALAAVAKNGRIVLGEAQNGENTLVPSAGQRVAVGQQVNIRSLNVFGDSDNVVRRVPLMLGFGDTAEPSMALELASRALGAAPRVAKSGDVSLADYTIPISGPNEMTLNFGAGALFIPTYSLGDLRACLQRGDKDFFRRNFSGKVVLIGSTFNQGDLKLTSARFTTAPELPAAERCLAGMNAVVQAHGDGTNGVYIHATAINNIMRREAIAELIRPWKWLICLLAGFLGGVAALSLAPPTIALCCLAFILLWTGSATALFSRAFAVPLFEPIVVGAITLVVTASYRLFVVDREKVILRHSFELYLAPAVIARMLSSNASPALGGELRMITTVFLDLVGYSTIAERLDPADLVRLMNRYLSAMSDVIEEYGGFVDKYVGDAIVAVFGAPLDAPNHATNAVHAALKCGAVLETLNQSESAEGGTILAHRVGINTGEAVVGNIGSKRRFNYTAIGDSVNIAARLESANRYFGTAILVSETTMTETGNSFFWREIDTIKVKGRHQAIQVFEPLSPMGRETPEQRAWASAYAEGLASWRQRNFAAAAEAFSRFAKDSASVSFFVRAEESRIRPRGDWTSIFSIDH
jgi:adenylate cyclase